LLSIDNNDVRVSSTDLDLKRTTDCEIRELKDMEMRSKYINAIDYFPVCIDQLLVQLDRVR
jgi:hypothetical protein